MKKLMWVLTIALVFSVFLCSEVYSMKNPYNYRDPYGTGDDHGWGGEGDSYPGQEAGSSNGSGDVNAIGFMDFLFWKVVYPIIDDLQVTTIKANGNNNSFTEDLTNGNEAVRNQSNK